MIKKILFITNMAGKGIGLFSTAPIKSAKKLGYEFHIAANFSASNAYQILQDEKVYGIKIHNVDFSRAPLSKSNINALQKIVDIIKKEHIDYIHCNTPTGGLIGRLAGKRCKVEKVIYQAHGFHFYKGAPMKNWMIYYPVEKWLAHKTDAIITINTEDYTAAQKLKLKKGGRVYYVHGVGIDTQTQRMTDAKIADKRKEIGLQEGDFAFVSVGRLEKNKNPEVLIRAISLVDNPHIKLVFCGEGEERAMLEALTSDLHMTERVIFLGSRTDMPEIYQVVDALAMASFREGLSRTIMEGMAYGLPCVASDIRGNVDLIDENQGGFLCNPKDSKAFALSMNRIAENTDLQERMKQHNLKKIKQYDASVVYDEVTRIYRETFINSNV